MRCQKFSGGRLSSKNDAPEKSVRLKSLITCSAVSLVIMSESAMEFPRKPVALLVEFTSICLFWGVIFGNYFPFSVSRLISPYTARKNIARMTFISLGKCRNGLTCHFI